MIIELNEKRPVIGEDVYIAPTAVIIGDVTIENGANIWFGAVIRGDTGKISIGSHASIQDNAVIHVNSQADTVVEAGVIIGHGAVLEGCHIEERALIGMNSTVLSKAHIGKGAIVAAGSVIKEKQKIPAYHLAAGVPGKVIKPLSATQKARLSHVSEAYVKLSELYASKAKIVPEVLKNIPE